ncbi:MAG: penicillin-binding protein activator, partial [Coxiellaceae bacterium]|nr:penicillin-binding protein activator [Coxiellaceae bacterium]
GRNIAERFTQVWQRQGGKIVANLQFEDSNDLSKPIAELLEVTESEARANRLEKLLRQNVRSIPNRRQDVDMIFMVALPQQARSIRPMLSFYYAGNLPIYSTSLMYEPQMSEQKNTDLDHITFADMPWILGGLDEHIASIQQKSKDLWQQSFQENTKFYALGVDANEITQYLSQLVVFPHYSVHGATGKLYLLNDGHIYRQVQWATMKNGKPDSTNKA